MRNFIRLLAVGVLLGLMSVATNTLAQVGGGQNDAGNKIKDAIDRVQQKNAAYLEAAKQRYCSSGPCEGVVKQHFDRATRLQQQGDRLHGKNTADDYKALTQRGVGKQKIKKGQNGADDEIVTEPTYDDSAADEIVQQLDEVATLTEVATASVAMAPTPMVSASPSSLPSAPYSFLGSYRSDTGVALGLWATKHAAETASSTAQFWCNQDVFGYNVAAGCTVFAVIAETMASLADFDDFANGDIDSAEIRGSYERLEAVWNRVGTVSGQVTNLSGDIEERITALEDMVNTRMNAIEAKQNQIIQLLNTPQGQRPAFPK